MDFLVLSPPVCPPSEPPSGAFILASALQGHGHDTGFFDLSLLFYHSVLKKSAPPNAIARAVKYLCHADGYTPMEHRTAAGAINRGLKQFSKTTPGWRLTAMDITPPVSVHSPEQIATLLRHDNPFFDLWETELLPVLRTHRPKKILISVAYLSQLTAAISLAQFLEKQGTPYIVGGSLPRSLHSTGQGFELLKNVFQNIEVSNGSALLPHTEEHTFLEKLAYPNTLCDKPYLSCRPILPLTLSTGCYWSGCLFCPDNEMKYIQLKMHAFEQFIATIPPGVMAQKPVIHLLDSAMPKNRLRAFMPIAKKHHLQFYGFARPEERFLQNDFLNDLSNSGCLMLQLGIEGGNDALLQRFNKGIHPNISAQVLQQAAAAGIRTYVYLLFGLPGETEQEREDTRRLIRNNIHSVDFLNLSIFNLPKHCELTERAAEFQMVIDDYVEPQKAIELYRPFTEPQMDISPRAAARAFISNRFTNDDAIRQAYLRTPKWFRAAHMALMNLKGRT